MADSSNTSPCKVSYNGALRRFLLASPASWTEFEYKIRTCFSLSPELELSVQYKDDEGDIITLSTESELQDVLAMHAIFHQSAPVKFEITAFDPQQSQTSNAFPIPPSGKTSVSQSEAPSVAVSSVASPSLPNPQLSLTAWGLAQLRQEHDGESSIHSSSVQESSVHESDTPLAKFYRQGGGAPYHKRYGSEQSDDVSLIELEDGMEPPSRQEEDITSTRATSPRVESQQQLPSLLNLMSGDQSLIYPMQEIENTMEEIKQTGQQPVQDHEHTSESTTSNVAETFSRESSSSSMSQHTAIEQHEDDDNNSVAMDNAPVSELEALHIDTTTEDVAAEPSKDAKGKGRATDDAQMSTETVVDADADPAEPELPSASTTSSSMNARNYDDEDRALFEQFQLLIREFQHVIQNNPQLVALASSIFDKIVNQVKVNVESFATYLQHQAQNAAQAAQQAAAEATREAQEAAREAKEAARDAIRENTRNHPFFGSPSGCPFSDNKDFPFFPHQRFMNQQGGCGLRPSPPPRPAACTASPQPPTPPVPPMPPMPPMPGIFGSCSTKSSSSPQPTTPSPFIPGFPFTTPPPKPGKAPKWRGRPKAQDTEASRGEGSSSSSSPSAGMPGSFPCNTSMADANNGPGWVWMRLPDDDVKDQHLPPSTRAKYGWVWRDGNEKSASAEPAAASAEQSGDDPAPLYTPTASNDPPASFPFGGLGTTGDGSSWGDMFRGMRNAHGHHHHGWRRNTDTHSGEEAERSGRTWDDVRQASLRRRQTMLEVRHAALKAQQKAEEERKRLHQARVEQLVKKSRPHSHIGSFLFGSSSSTSTNNNDNSASTTATTAMGGGSLASIWPTPAPASTASTTTTTTTRTPGEFPQTNTSTPNPPVPPRPAAPAPPADIVPPVPPRAPTPPAAPAQNVTNPFQEPYEFENELQTLMSMGFPDTEEVRTALFDFGGEIEAVIDYLFRH
ncbi:hypothetical protein BGW42_005691 [Actinomortierella wolfii]|nr:hypothetical protein BGW42_005691 [Actinomortierella wolfii]